MNTFCFVLPVAISVFSLFLLDIILLKISVCYDRAEKPAIVFKVKE